MNMWQVLARLARLQPKIDAQERKSLVESGIRMGVALATGKPANMAYADYPQLASAQATDAIARLKRERTHDLSEPKSAVYEPLPPATDKMRAASLKRMIGTGHLPAVDKNGVLLQRYLDEHQRKQQGG